MPDTSSRLSLPYIQAAQAQKHVTHNEALGVLDMLVQPVVLDRDRTDAPAAPIAGVCYLVAQGATGLWAGQDNNLATWDGGAWIFQTPAEGWQVRVLSEERVLVFKAGTWVAGCDVLLQLGINTTANAADRLSVRSDGALFTHAGTDHRLRLNKASGADTTSLIFQSNWSGRAEIGLAGSDSFSIKTSADGQAWVEALQFDPATGAVSGQAIQQTATDVTPGRLMRADWGYGPGNILGAVTESGGQPTGALIESGSNAAGRYMRFADGGQICTGAFAASNVAISTAFAGGYRSDLAENCVFAMGFSAPPKVVLALDSLSGAGAMSLGHSSVSNTACAPQFWRATSDTVDVSASYIAVGRWF